MKARLYLHGVVANLAKTASLGGDSRLALKINPSLSSCSSIPWGQHQAFENFT
jgi:hypothetical protein